jgi:hypothetical protein
MLQLDPLGKMLADSLESRDPKTNDRSFYAAWRAIALALLEYRRGRFDDAIYWLEDCSRYPGQPLSCVAATHTLRSMVLVRLGKTDEASAELTLGRNMIDEQLKKGLQWSDNVSGSMAGWLHARILLREAISLRAIPGQ